MLVITHFIVAPPHTTGVIWTERPTVPVPCAGLSLFCTALYTISWQFDPCCKYQVEHDASKLLK